MGQLLLLTNPHLAGTCAEVSGGSKDPNPGYLWSPGYFGLYAERVRDMPNPTLRTKWNLTSLDSSTLA